MFSIFKRKPKEDWRFLKTFDIDVSVTRSTEKGNLYIHLFESNLGNRKYESATTIRNVPDDEIQIAVKRTILFQTKIYRWLNGRVDPDIPTYDDVPAEETANVLKGKIS